MHPIAAFADFITIVGAFVTGLFCVVTLGIIFAVKYFRFALNLQIPRSVKHATVLVNNEFGTVCKSGAVAALVMFALGILGAFCYTSQHPGHRNANHPFVTESYTMCDTIVK